MPLTASRALDGPASHGMKTSNAQQQHEAKDVVAWPDGKTIQGTILTFLGRFPDLARGAAGVFVPSRPGTAPLPSGVTALCEARPAPGYGTTPRTPSSAASPAA